MSARREALLSAAVAGTIAALLAWLGPPGTDFAAHAYQRTLFLEHGFTFWNNFWYAGRYSFVTYSVLYYPLAALLGIKLLAVATIALGALAFAVVVGREWGLAARWSSRTFAVVWAGIVLSAAFPFALGFALGLLALWALQAGARWRFGVLAVLTIAASPLAFLLLALFLAGAGSARLDGLWRNRVVVAWVVAVGLVEVLVWRIFPDAGRFPFSGAEVASALAFCAAVFAGTWRVEDARVLRFFSAIYAAAIVTLYFVPSAIGENIDRLRFTAVPLVVLVFSLRHWRPRVPCVAVLVLAIAWNVSPLLWSLAKDGGDSTASAAAWSPAVSYLRTHLGHAYRVEAVDTPTHSAAVYLAGAGIPLARGWYRQDDFPQNELLYDQRLGARVYVAWLHELGVRYVVLPRTAPTDYSSRAEAKLVRSGRAGLRRVFRTRDLAIYRVPGARPIAPGLQTLTESEITIAVHRPGSVRIAVRYSPYWHASHGCLSKGRDGMLRLTTSRSRMVTIAFGVSASRAFNALTGDQPVCAPAR
jgi:hypothetical protein